MITIRKLPAIERILIRAETVDRGYFTPCRVWIGTLNARGYGLVGHENRQVLVHRLVYEMLVGPIPDGYEIDHLCRQPDCHLPSHLEAVTHAENMRRGEGGLRRQQLMAAETHCKHGHEWTQANTYIRSNGNRRCRACANRRHREARAAGRAA